MTKNLLLTLLVAFSALAQGADTTQDRMKRMEDTLELTLRVNHRIAIELERLNEKVALLEKESRRDNVLIEGLIGDVIELRKRGAK